MNEVLKTGFCSHDDSYIQMWKPNEGVTWLINGHPGIVLWLEVGYDEVVARCSDGERVYQTNPLDTSDIEVVQPGVG